MKSLPFFLVINFSSAIICGIIWPNCFVGEKMFGSTMMILGLLVSFSLPLSFQFIKYLAVWRRDILIIYVEAIIVLTLIDVLIGNTIAGLIGR